MKRRRRKKVVFADIGDAIVFQSGEGWIMAEVYGQDGRHTLCGWGDVNTRILEGTDAYVAKRVHYRIDPRRLMSNGPMPLSQWADLLSPHRIK